MKIKVDIQTTTSLIEENILVTLSDHSNFLLLYHLSLGEDDFQM